VLDEYESHNLSTAFTAAVGLFRNLKVPLPFEKPDPSAPKTPLVINATSGAVGSFALRLATLNPNIETLIAIAGASSASSKELGAHVVLDYRSPTIAADLETALGGKKIEKILDCTNSPSSAKYLLPVLDAAKGRYTCTAGITPEQKVLMEHWGGRFEQIWVGSVHEDNPAGGKMFGAVMSRIFEDLIAQGILHGRPYQIVEGGLNGVKDALTKLRDRKSGNAKYVTRIADTDGLKVE
jgi:NADPH:quinone reductase-like Zn-dependent oxidoreductase